MCEHLPGQIPYMWKHAWLIKLLLLYRQGKIFPHDLMGLKHSKLLVLHSWMVKCLIKAVSDSVYPAYTKGNPKLQISLSWKSFFVLWVHLQLGFLWQGRLRGQCVKTPWKLSFSRLSKGCCVYYSRTTILLSFITYCTVALFLAYVLLNGWHPWTWVVYVRCDPNVTLTLSHLEQWDVGYPMRHRAHWVTAQNSANYIVSSKKELYTTRWTLLHYELWETFHLIVKCWLATHFCTAIYFLFLYKLLSCPDFNL